ncbi:MAG: hypothetical protein ACOC1F_10360, partial [Myxococcota bacterium]
MMPTRAAGVAAGIGTMRGAGRDMRDALYARERVNQDTLEPSCNEPSCIQQAPQRARAVAVRSMLRRERFEPQHELSDRVPGQPPVGSGTLAEEGSASEWAGRVDGTSPPFIQQRARAFCA